jgi:hypothetical protein
MGRSEGSFYEKVEEELDKIASNFLPEINLPAHESKLLICRVGDSEYYLSHEYGAFSVCVSCDGYDESPYEPIEMWDVPLAVISRIPEGARTLVARLVKAKAIRQETEQNVLADLAKISQSLKKGDK